MAPTTFLRRTLAAVLVACSVTVLVLPASSASAATPAEEEYSFLQKHNRARVNAGLSAMRWDSELAATARGWSQKMARDGRISHDPNLARVAAQVEPSWRSIGENVGVGYSVQSLFDAFMGSSGHRANIMKATYNRVGIGVVHSGGRIWVTVRFLQGPAISGTTGLGPPPPPPGVPSNLSGDFDGDGYGDFFTYGPGSTTDESWFGRWGRAMLRRSASVNGQYRPAAGDFNGDGKTEIFWYAPGSAGDTIWTWNGSGWSGRAVTVNGTYWPMVGDFDGDGQDDILWYGPGTATDAYWYGNANGTFTQASTSVAGNYRPVVGDFDGRNGDDIFWYGVGSGGDHLYYSTGVRARYTAVTQSVAGSYWPSAGDFNGDGVEDILWYAPGTSQDATWFMSRTQGSHRTVLRTVNGTSYVPAADDFDGNNADDVVWFSPSSAYGDPMWWSSPGSTSASPSTVH